MKRKPTASNDGPLKIDQPFDHAIANALKVKPPPGGWKAYEAGLKATAKRTKLKRAD